MTGPSGDGQQDHLASNPPTEQTQNKGDSIAEEVGDVAKVVDHVSG